MSSWWLVIRMRTLDPWQHLLGGHLIVVTVFFLLSLLLVVRLLRCLLWITMQIPENGGRPGVPGQHSKIELT